MSEYDAIPEHMMAALRRYVDHHIPPGHFLTAVITNNLSDACSRADDTNLKLLRTYARWFYNKAPSLCHGSPKAYKTWIEEQQE